MAELKEFAMEDARIIFRNFAGKEGQFNSAGDRNFALVLDEESAAILAKDGWNVNRLKPREDEDEVEGTPYLPVKVGYKGRPPHVILISSRARTALHEDTVDVLDITDIQTVDLIVRPYEWEVNGKSGTKAYLKTMFVTVNEDYLMRKYAQMEEEPER